MIVLLALLTPLFFGMGAVVMDVGNWFVHKKRLQTLVDAAAFAAGTEFGACFQAPGSTNLEIANRALEYAGDTARDASTRNLQVQEPADVRVALNSSEYWSQTNATAPASAGYGLDYTLPPVDSAGRPAPDSLPCSVKFLDVKATDDEAPLLWGLLPLHPSPKAKARIEIRQVQALSGMLPWGIPEQDPAKVAALIVHEDRAATASDSVVGVVSLVRQTNLPPNDPLRSWSVWRGDGMNVPVSGGQNFGVVILTSRDPNASTVGSLSSICNQNPVQTRCYAGGTPTSGLSFIHAYSAGTPAVDVRDVQLVSLTCVNDLSAPYFALNGNCSVEIQAVVDFGVSDDPTDLPTCASVSSSSGGNMTWSAGGIGGALGTWTTTFTLATADTSSAGRNVINLTAWHRNPSRDDCNNRLTTTLPKVAAPYVANDASGPVEYLEVHNPDTGLPGNSLESGPSNLRITVGLVPPLEVTQNWNDPPIYLRVTTNSSQTQAIDCDGPQVSGPAGNHANFRNEIIDGCYTYYTVNRRNGSCSGYNNGNLPPASTEPVPPNPYPDCVITQTGVSAGQIRQALRDRFGGSPCKTLNNWPKSASDPFPDPSDGRIVTLFVVDTTSFSGSGQQIYPIRKFGNFYLTGGDGLGCPGDDPPPPGTRQASAWGHFYTIAEVDPNLRPSEEQCEFADVGVCLAVLVE